MNKKITINLPAGVNCFILTEEERLELLESIKALLNRLEYDKTQCYTPTVTEILDRHIKQTREQIEWFSL